MLGNFCDAFLVLCLRSCVCLTRFFAVIIFADCGCDALEDTVDDVFDNLLLRACCDDWADVLVLILIFGFGIFTFILVLVFVLLLLLDFTDVTGVFILIVNLLSGVVVDGVDDITPGCGLAVKETVEVLDEAVADGAVDTCCFCCCC